MTARKIEEYPYAECRDQRHHWKPFDAVLDYKEGIAYRIQQCGNCPTKKHSLLSLRKTNYGELLGHVRYSYPRNYFIPGGLDKRDLGQMRMHNVLREAHQKTA